MTKKQFFFVSISLIALNSFGQQVIATSGGSSSPGGNGSASFTMGHLDLKPVSASGGIVSGSIQQPIEVYEVTSTINITNEIVKVYPNPSADKVILETSSNSFKSYTLSDGKGSIIIKESKINSSNEIDLANLNSGIYFINL